MKKVLFVLFGAAVVAGGVAAWKATNKEETIELNKTVED